MHCGHCGAEMRPLDKFCRKCGDRRGEKQSEATPVPSVSTEPQDIEKQSEATPVPSVSTEPQDIEKQIEATPAPSVSTEPQDIEKQIEATPAPSVSTEPQAPTQPQDIPATRELFRSNETPPASRPYVPLAVGVLAVGVVVLSAILFGVAEDWYRSERAAAILPLPAGIVDDIDEGATTSEAIVDDVDEGATTREAIETFLVAYLEWSGMPILLEADGMLDMLLKVAGASTCRVVEAAGSRRLLRAIGCVRFEDVWINDTWKGGLFTVFTVFVLFFLFLGVGQSGGGERATKAN